MPNEPTPDIPQPSPAPTEPKIPPGIPGISEPLSIPASTPQPKPASRGANWGSRYNAPGGSGRYADGLKAKGPHRPPLFGLYRHGRRFHPVGRHERFQEARLPSLFGPGLRKGRPE